MDHSRLPPYLDPSRVIGTVIALSIAGAALFLAAMAALTPQLLPVASRGLPPASTADGPRASAERGGPETAPTSESPATDRTGRAVSADDRLALAPTPLSAAAAFAPPVGRLVSSAPGDAGAASAKPAPGGDAGGRVAAAQTKSKAAKTKSKAAKTKTKPPKAKKKAAGSSNGKGRARGHANGRSGKKAR